MSNKTFFVILSLINIVFTYKLEQVVIISRHNIRAPLMKGDVRRATPHKTWLDWNETSSHLTERGALIETYMGNYFSQWLQKEGLHHGCPEAKAVIYANDRQRTKETAKKFTETAFEKCNVSMQVEKDYFFPVVSDSEYLRKKIDVQIESELENMNIDDAYRTLNSILDIKNSKICEEDLFCDFTEKKNIIVYNSSQLDVRGPIEIANSAVDAFLMAYYNGVPLEKIGWGKIKEEDFVTLTKITRLYHNIRYNGTNVCPHNTVPLLKKMYQVFENISLNYALFFGHDTTLSPVMCALGFKQVQLPNSLEDTPIGSKLVFQKWYDEKCDRYLMKVNYVYPTTQQLRKRSELSLETPPESVVMELADCAIDENGFCPWSDFLKILEKLLLE